MGSIMCSSYKKGIYKKNNGILNFWRSMMSCWQPSSETVFSNHRYFWIKITKVVVDRDGKNTDQLSVHSFVDRGTGLVYKAAGWNAPAKGARFDLLDEASRKRCFENADPYGSYLYR